MEGHGGDFTFAVAAPLAGGGRLYPVFGRPRPRSPSCPRAPGPETTSTARVPLGRFLLVDRGRAAQPPDGGEAAKTWYFSWCPGSPPPVARCRKSGSTGLVPRWRQRLLGRRQSDDKEKFVFLDERKASSVGGHVWSYYAKKGAGNDGRRRSFLPYRQDLVGMFASATVFRRSYHPF